MLVHEYKKAIKRFVSGDFHSQPKGRVRLEKSGLYVPEGMEKFVLETEDLKATAVQIPSVNNLVKDIYDDPKYFSSAHGAYIEGYTLDNRLEKYKDAVENVVEYMDITNGYIDLGGGLGYFAFGVALCAIDKGKIERSEVKNLIATLDLTSIPTDKRIKEMGITSYRSKLIDMPFGNDTFSAITCFHVMGHIEAQELNKSITEITRITKRRGIIYLIIPTLDGRVQDNSEIFDQIFYDTTHITFGTRLWWIKKFEETRLTYRADLVEKFDTKNYGWVFVFQKDY